MSLPRPLAGFALACLSSLLGGTAVATTRLVVTGLEPLSVAAIRYAIAALLLAPLAMVAMRRISLRDAPAIAALGLLFYALFPYLFTLALAHTTAARGALALSTLPLLTMAVAVGAGVEQFRLVKLLGILVALSGVALALAGSATEATNPAAWQGDLIMVATALVGAVYNVAARPYLQRYSAMAVAAIGIVLGALVLSAIAAAGNGLRLDAITLPVGGALAYLGVVGCALTFWLWSAALERAAPTSVAITVTLNPVSAMALGALLLGEPVPLALLFGLATVLAGIVLANWPDHARPRRR